MKEFLLSAPAQAVIWTAVLLILVAAGGLIVGIFRGRSADDRPLASDLLTNFRELHHQGDINDAEFRTIKTVLDEQFQQELRDTDGES